jgi:hypothetical protein
MPQGDLVVANQSGAAFRSDVNAQLLALGTLQSGATAPTPTTYAYQWWANTTDGLLYIRNGSNTDPWIVVGTLADTNLGLLSLAGGTLTGALLADDSGTAALPAIAFDGDPDTGAFRAGANEFGIATNGVERVEFGTSEVVFNDGGANYDFRIEGDTNANLFKIDAGLDEVQVANLNGGQLAGTRNRIINGDMRIDQRNNGAVVTLAVADAYTIDRWNAQEDTDGGMTAERSTTAPAGFIYSLLFTTTTADTSLGATQSAWFRQHVEGFNVDDLAWGTANAKTITLSFWVRSSLTGTFGGSATNSAVNRSYPFTFTISSANTFEYKTITIPGDTTGTWLADAGRGITIFLGLGVGSTYSGTAATWAGAAYYSATGATSVVGTNGATFYITGVQLEPGTVATPFERRSYGQELALCQRYYELLPPVSVQFPWASATQVVATNVAFKATKRAPPSVNLTGVAGSTGTATLTSFTADLAGSLFSFSGNAQNYLTYTGGSASIEL